MTSVRYAVRDFAAELHARRAQHLYRQRRTVSAVDDVYCVVDGARVLNFCSNDYLGLARHPDVVSAFQGAASAYGVGATAAHLVCGHHAPHHALEAELAAFTGFPRALLFSTGYMANLGIANALLGRGDAVFEDRLNHASLIDAGLHSGAQFQRYRHCDVEHLQSQLAQTDARHALIMTDGVFSMDGDLAPLSRLSVIARAHGALLMVDDAHGFGVLGAHGRGSVEHSELSPSAVDVYMGTLGKAVGTFGAFVAANDDIIETLIQSARPYIYTTALPPAVAEATRASLRVLQKESWRREHLRALIARFRAGASQLGLRLMESATPIQPIVFGDSEAALRASEALFQRGFWVGAIRPPTVPQGSARLRVTFTAAHRETQVDALLSALEGCV